MFTFRDEVSIVCYACGSGCLTRYTPKPTSNDRSGQKMPGLSSSVTQFNTYRYLIHCQWYYNCSKTPKHGYHHAVTHTENFNRILTTTNSRPDVIYLKLRCVTFSPSSPACLSNITVIKRETIKNVTCNET